MAGELSSQESKSDFQKSLEQMPCGHKQKDKSLVHALLGDPNLSNDHEGTTVCGTPEWYETLNSKKRLGFHDENMRRMLLR